KVDSALPDIALVQLLRGAVRIEQRCSDGAWKTAHARAGDLFLNPPGNGTRAIRWRSLTDEAPQTLHVRLSAELFARTAAEMTGHDPAHVMLVGRSGFQDSMLQQLGMALLSELERPTTAGTPYGQTAANMLAVHLLRHYASTAVAMNEPAPALTQRQLHLVTDYIFANLEQDLSLAVLAQEVGFSPYHFA